MGSTLLRAKVQTDGERKIVTRLINASARMNRMISQLVDFAAVRLGGEIEFAREPTDFVALVRETTEEIERARGILVTLDAPEAAHGSWDPLRVEQVVFNLVTNAAVHGAAPISVRVLTTDIDVTLEVADAGPTLSQEVLAQLFLPIRKRFSATREAGSLGLGLYVTEQIVHAHGGRIEARSTADGTVLRVVLPRAPSSD
jgi:signal transduction histidine kinase